MVGVDWRTSLADAAARVGPGVALQGNLDPVALLAGWPVVEKAARAVVDDGRLAVDAGAAGHIFNLGHGVLPGDRPRGPDRPGGSGAFAVTSQLHIALSAAAFRDWWPHTGFARAGGPTAPGSLLFDPADRLGGMLRTEQLGGQPMDIGAEAFVVRRPEVPALLAELGLSGRQISTTGVRPTIYSQARLHPLPPDTVNGIPTSAASVTGLVDDATIAQMAAEPHRRLQWRARRGPRRRRGGGRPIRRAGGDPIGRSDAVRGVRRVGGDDRHPRRGPTVAAALDAGAASLTEAVRRALPTSTGGPVFGAIEGGYGCC